MKPIIALVTEICNLRTQVVYLRKRLHHCTCGEPMPAVTFSISIAEQPIIREDIKIMLLLTPTQHAVCKIDQILPKGAKFDGVPEWSTSDPAVASVTPAADGLSADVVATGIGTVVVTFTGDKKHGAEVSAFVATLDVQVQTPDVESATITAGAPEEQA